MGASWVCPAARIRFACSIRTDFFKMRLLSYRRRKGGDEDVTGRTASCASWNPAGTVTLKCHVLVRARDSHVECYAFGFHKDGFFPENCKPGRPHPNPPSFRTDEIVWAEEFNPSRLCFLEYSDNEGTVTQRFVHLSCRGTGSNHYKYLGAFDIGVFKTFRADRVLRLEEV